MVVRTVPRFHALVGFVAAAVALPIGCSSEDFEGCAASRTCPSSGDAGEAGGGADTGGTSGRGGSTGEAGSGADTGGSSGAGGSSEGGAGGTSGAAGSGEGGDGGSDDDTDPPTVVSFSPADGDTDVERDVTVTAELSEPIDEASVTSESVTLSGPDGEMSGTVTVDDNVITFVPDRPLSLLATYTFTLSDSVADLAGNTLAQSETAEFRARDGRWSEPVFPFGTTVSRRMERLQRNFAGDAVLGMTLSPSREAVYGAVYDAANNQWTNAAELTRTAGVQQGVAGVGLDASRRAVVTWTNSGGGSWSRFNGASAWTSAGEVGRNTQVTATPAGVAAAAWVPSLPVASTQTLDLSSGQVAPVVPLDLTETLSSPFPLASLERLGVLWLRVAANQLEQEMVIAWKEGNTWSDPEQIAQGPEMAYYLFDSDEAGNIIVVWREADQIWSRIYERSRNAWSRELPIADTTSIAAVVDVDITAGNAIVAVNSNDATEGSWAAVYRPSDGWSLDRFARLDDPGIGYPIDVSIDSAGNGLAVWQSELKFRRYVAGEGWQPVSSLEADVADDYVFSAGAPDGSVLVVANDLQQNASGVPMAIRFE